MKASSNGRFLLILLDGKKRVDECSLGKNRGTKVVEASFENSFFINLFHQPSFCLPKTDVGIYRKDPIANGKGDNPGLAPDTPNIDRRADNLGKGTNTPDTNNIDGIANGPGISIDRLDADKKADNKRMDDLSIGTDRPDVDRRVGNRRANNLGTDIIDADPDAYKRANPSIDPKDTNTDVRATANNKACTFLFSLSKIFFFYSFLLNQRSSLPFRYLQSFFHHFQ